MLNIIKNTINRVFASGVDSDASAFITATGLSGTTQKSAITTLVKDLKSSGLWSKMKAVYPMVTDNYNLLSYTEDFTNAAWLNDQASSTANQTIAPNGTNTADKLIENSANNHHLNYQSVSATVGQIYTFSVYLKAAERSYAAIQVADSIVPVNRYTVLVDLINGTILGTRNSNSPTNTSSSIQSVGNGWYRVTATMKQVAGTSFFGHIATSNSATPTYDIIDFPTYTGNGTSGIFIWGAQIELGTSASTYQAIATTPSAFMASQMKYNLKDARDLDAAFRLTWSGGWTYSATGATPNGTNAYADTKLNENNVLSSNNSHISIYSRTNASGLYCDIGTNSTNQSNIYPNYLNKFYTRIQAVNAGFSLNYNTAALFISNRVNSTEVQGWRNNVKNVLANNSTGKDSFNFYIGAGNNVVAVDFSPRQLAFATIGDGLTDIEALVFNQIVEKYQVALSRGVQAAQSFYYNSAYSNEANTYLYSTQITGTTQVSAINTLINGLKANNLWAKMKAVYPFVTDKTLQADMAAQMKFNLVNPQDSDAAFRLAFSGGWTYSTNGAQPNGTNGYADTKLVPNTDLTLNNSSFSVYSRTAIPPLTNQSWGVTSSGSFLPIIGATIDTTTRINGFSYSYASPDVMNSATGLNFAAMFLLSRTSATSAKLFRNITQLASTSTQGQASQPTTTFTFGALRNSASFQDYNNFQYGFAHISNGLSDAEIIIFYQLVQQFQTDLSRQV